MQKVTLPNKDQSKDLVYLAVAIAIIVVVVIAAKNISKLFKTGAQGLGLSNSDEKADVNANFNSGKSPLFSYTFPIMQKQAPAGAPLLTVAQIHLYITKLQDYRGLFFDDSGKAVGLFDNFKSQFQVAWFAYRFQIETGNDLFDWLRKSDTLFSQGFNAETVDKIVRRVNSLPKY